MQSERSLHGQHRLEQLTQQAKDFALLMMRTTGSVLPIVIADTNES